MRARRSGASGLTDHNVLINLEADSRKRMVPYFASIYTIGDGGRSYLWRIRPGHYTDFRELSATPRASDYDARFRATKALRGSPDFNVKLFNSNAVLRWEYKPGSTLFAVWQQGREQFDRDPGEFRASRDYRNLFGTRPANTFLIKASYWLNL